MFQSRWSCWRAFTALWDRRNASQRKHNPCSSHHGEHRIKVSAFHATCASRRLRYAAPVPAHRIVGLIGPDSTPHLGRNISRAFYLTPLLGHISLQCWVSLFQISSCQVSILNGLATARGCCCNQLLLPKRLLLIQMAILRTEV